jgi:hypothetical protein
MPDGTLHVEDLPVNFRDEKMQDTRRLGLRYQAEAIRKSIGEGRVCLLQIRFLYIY